jgi:hypothetical protein
MAPLKLLLVEESDLSPDLPRLTPSLRALEALEAEGATVWPLQRHALTQMSLSQAKAYLQGLLTAAQQADVLVLPFVPALLQGRFGGASVLKLWRWWLEQLQKQAPQLQRVLILFPNATLPQWPHPWQQWEAWQWPPLWHQLLSWPQVHLWVPHDRAAHAFLAEQWPAERLYAHPLPLQPPATHFFDHQKRHVLAPQSYAQSQAYLLPSPQHKLLLFPLAHASQVEAFLHLPWHALSSPLTVVPFSPTAPPVEALLAVLQQTPLPLGHPESLCLPLSPQSPNQLATLRSALRLAHAVVLPPLLSLDDWDAYAQACSLGRPVFASASTLPWGLKAKLSPVQQAAWFYPYSASKEGGGSPQPLAQWMQRRWQAPALEQATSAWPTLHHTLRQATQTHWLVEGLASSPAGVPAEAVATVEC